MTEVQEINGNGQALQANFDAFKFPTSDVVQFRALVTPCIPRCDPVRCDATDYLGQSHSTKSFGRRRRKRSNLPKEDSKEMHSQQHQQQRPNSRKMPTPNVELKVASLIHISDKFDESSILDDTVKSRLDATRDVNTKSNLSYFATNLGSYSSSQDWDQASHTFESTEKCAFRHEEKCNNDL